MSSTCGVWRRAAICCDVLAAQSPSLPSRVSPAPRCPARRLSAQNPHTFPLPLKKIFRGTSWVSKRLSTARSALILTRFNSCAVSKGSLYGDPQPAAPPPASVRTRACPRATRRVGLSPGGCGHDVGFSTSAVGTSLVQMQSPQRVAVPPVSLKYAWFANNSQ